MAVSRRFDVVVIGAGVMGISCALRLREAGMSVAIIDQGALCRGASGANAGTLTEHMVKPQLVEHARRGQSLWEDSTGWLGGQITVVHKPGFALAFTDAEAELLALKVEKRRAAGADVRLISREEARRLEPALSSAAKAVALGESDGTIVSYEFGHLARAQLSRCGVELMEYRRIHSVDAKTGGFRLTIAGGETLVATQVVLAGGAQLAVMFGWFGLGLPLDIRLNQISVLERMPPLLKSVVTVADERLSLKQMPNGTTLVGGGWQARLIPGTETAEVDTQALIGNLRLAVHCVPALRQGRVIRVWIGHEAETADGLPILGPVPGVDGLWAIGAVSSGFTSGPYMGRLLAEAMLGIQGDVPLFPPDRLLSG